jgi:azurin
MNIQTSIILTIILLFSCGQNNSTKTIETKATKQTYEFTINAIGNTMMDMSYDTKEIKVTSGSKIKINLINQGTDAAMLHNIVFVQKDMEKDVAMEGISLKEQNYFNPKNPNVIAGSTVAAPGATVTFEFIAPETGVYSYICTYPGHWMKMRGTLIVE